MSIYVTFLVLEKNRFFKNDQCEIISCLSLGYCRVRNMAQGKEIETSLYAILPNSLNRDVLIIPDDLPRTIIPMVGNG